MGFPELRAAGIVLTAAVMMFLVIIPPNLAVVVSTEPAYSGGKEHFAHTEDVVFHASVDIELSEAIPLKHLEFIIYDDSSSVLKNCSFGIEGSPISGCGNIRIEKTGSPINYTYAWLNGYGANPGEPYQMVSFGYGYGYGSDSSAASELNYTISWNASADGHKNGSYSALLMAIASKDSQHFAYSQDSPSGFIIKNNRPQINAPYAPNGFNATSGVPFFFRVNASDPDNDTLEYFSSSGVFAIDGNSGIISFVPDDSMIGQHTAIITVSDGVSSASETYPFAVISNDTSAPVISGLAAVAVTNVSAEVIWSTNENANSTIEYGTSPGELRARASSHAMETSHSFSLAGLEPGTSYYFRAIACDKYGNCASSPVESFGTNANPDLDAPVISGISVSSITNETAVVEWETDESANSTVHFGESAGAYTWKGASGQHRTSHSIMLYGLRNSTAYYFRVESCDSSGNCGLSDEDSFLTLGNQVEEEAEEDEYEEEDFGRQIKISGLRIINEEVAAGEALLASLHIYNTGSDELEGIKAAIVIPELGIRSSVGPFDLESREGKSRIIYADIPDGAVPGEYTARITVSNDDYRRVRHRQIVVV